MSLRDEIEGLQLKGNVGKLVDWLAANDVGLDAIGSAKLYQGFHKDADDEAQVVDMVSLELSPAWLDGPKWPLIDRPPPVKIARLPGKKPAKPEARTVVCLPDPQIGYWRDMDTGDLEPMHDTRAMDVALQIGVAANPHEVINLGDTLDLAEFGKFGNEPTLDQTTNPALATAHQFLAVQRAHIDPESLIVMEGNHDKRLADAVAKHNRAALYVRKADSTPDDWPVFSIPYLLCLDSLGVEYVDGYPAGQYWLTDSFVVEHGKRINSGGSTAAKQSREAPGISAVFGHVHRIEVHTRSVVVGSEDVRRNVFVSPGCLCRTDGAVPSYGSGSSTAGRPVVNHEDWQQGLAVLTFPENGDAPQVETVFIDDGRAMFRGELYEAGPYLDLL